MEKRKEKTLIKNTLLFSIGNIGSKLLSLVIVPLYTYYISVEQLGIYDVTNTYVTLFMPIACMTVYESVYRWLLDNKQGREVIVVNGVWLMLSSILVFDGIALVIMNCTDFHYKAEFLLLVDTGCIYSFSQFTTRGLRNNRLYAIQGLVYTIILLSFDLILVVGMNFQAKGLLWATIIANVGTTFLMICKQNLFQGIQKTHLLSRELLTAFTKYSIPMVPNAIAWWLVSASNRLVINWHLGDAANGLYAIALKFPSVLTMLSTFFYQAWQEQAISEFDSQNRDAYYSDVFNNYVRILLSAVLLLIPATKLIIMFMEVSYHAAFQYVGFLYLSVVFNSFASFYGTGYLSTKKTAGAFFTTIVGAIFNVLFSVILIPYCGLYAAAVGNMLSYLIIWLFRVFQTKKYFSICVNWKTMLALLTLNIGMILLIQSANSREIIIVELFTCGLVAFINKGMFKHILSQILAKAKF